MYKYEEIEAKVGELSPALRGLAEELLRRGKQFEYAAPLDEVLESPQRAAAQIGSDRRVAGVRRDQDLGAREEPRGPLSVLHGRPQVVLALHEQHRDVGHRS